MSWLKHLEYVLLCWTLICPFVYCQYPSFLQGDLFESVLDVLLFLVLFLYLCFQIIQMFRLASKRRWPLSSLSLSSACSQLAFNISFLGYSFTDIGVVTLGLFILLTMHLDFIILILLLNTLWMSDPCLIIVLCVHGLLSFHQPDTVNPVGRVEIDLQVSTSSLAWNCLFQCRMVTVIIITFSGRSAKSWHYDISWLL